MKKTEDREYEVKQKEEAILREIEEISSLLNNLDNIYNLDREKIIELEKKLNNIKDDLTIERIVSNDFVINIPKLFKNKYGWQSILGRVNSHLKTLTYRKTYIDNKIFIVDILPKFIDIILIRLNLYRNKNLSEEERNTDVENLNKCFIPLAKKIHTENYLYEISNKQDLLPFTNLIDSDEVASNYWIEFNVKSKPLFPPPTFTSETSETSTIKGYLLIIDNLKKRLKQKRGELSELELNNSKDISNNNLESLKLKYSKVHPVKKKKAYSKKPKLEEIDANFVALVYKDKKAKKIKKEGFPCKIIKFMLLKRKNEYTFSALEENVIFSPDDDLVEKLRYVKKILNPLEITMNINTSKQVFTVSY